MVVVVGGAEEGDEGKGLHCIEFFFSFFSRLGVWHSEGLEWAFERVGIDHPGAAIGLFDGHSSLVYPLRIK